MIVVCNVAEVELALTLAALPAILRATILEVGTRCNWRVACNIARNVAPCVPALIRLLSRLSFSRLVWSGENKLDIKSSRAFWASKSYAFPLVEIARPHSPRGFERFFKMEGASKAHQEER